MHGLYSFCAAKVEIFMYIFQIFIHIFAEDSADSLNNKGQCKEVSRKILSLCAVYKREK